MDARAPECPDQGYARVASGLLGLDGVGGTLPGESGAEQAGELLTETSGH